MVVSLYRQSCRKNQKGIYIMKNYNLEVSADRLEVAAIVNNGTVATRYILNQLEKRPSVMDGLKTPVQEWQLLCGQEWPSRVLGNGSVKPYGLTEAKNRCTTNEQRLLWNVGACINSMVAADRALLASQKIKEVKLAAPAAPGAAAAPAAPAAPVKIESGDSVAALIAFTLNNRISDSAKLSLFGF